MLSQEQFEASFNKQEQELEQVKQQAEAFCHYLAANLVANSVNYFKGLEEHCLNFHIPLLKEAHRLAVEIFEPLETFLYGNFTIPEENLVLSKIPERDVTEEENQWLADTLKTLPVEQHAFFIEENNIRLKVEHIKREHLFQCHDKVKEALWKFYPEIVDLEAAQIRYMDSYSFTSTLEYEEIFYNYAYDYISDEYFG